MSRRHHDHMTCIGYIIWNMDGERKYKHGQWGKRFGRWCLLCHLSAWFWGALRTVPTIVTAHILCAYQGSRATRKKCATRRTRGLVCLLKVWEVLVISCGKNASFFNRWKIFSIYIVSSLKTEEVCTFCYFHVWSIWPNIFIVKQKSILKHQKLLLQDVTLRAWVLKNPLIGKDQ